MHAGATIRVDNDIDARAATGQRIAWALVPGRGCDPHSPEVFDGRSQCLATHATQLPGDHAGLPLALCGRGQVCELAATDAARSSLRPDGLDAVARGLDDLDGVRPRKLLLDSGHARTDDLAGCRVAHEDDASTVVSGDARAAVGWLTDGQLEDLADALARLYLSGTATRRRATMRRAGAHAFSSGADSPRELSGWSLSDCDSSEEGAPTRKKGSLTR